MRVQNLADAQALPGVYSIDIDPPAATPQPSLDWVGFVARFAWGPDTQIVTIGTPADYLAQFAPGGLAASYASTGHRAAGRARGSLLKFVRVRASGFGAPTSGAVAPQGTTGSTAYGYKVVPLVGSRVGAATAELTTATGNATLSGGNFNRITWAAPTNAIEVSGYRIYRVTGGATQGLIATVASDVLTLDDTGLAGGGESVPTVNQTVAATASMILQSSGAVNILNVAGKYHGDLGSQITLTVGSADDGVSSHFNLTVRLGTVIEVYRNLSVLSSGAGVVLGDQSASQILAPLSAVTANLGASTRPVNGTYTLGVAASNVASAVAGCDGVALASDYTGTAGTGDAGIALFEGDSDVTLLTVDDVGTSRRAAVNVALATHGDTYDRRVVLCFDSGTSRTAAATLLNATPALRTENAVLAYPWVYVLDENAARVLVPHTLIRACAIASVPQHLGQHWKDPRATRAYRNIVALEYSLSRPELILAQNTGISPLVPTADSWAPKADCTTSLVPGHTKLARVRLASYLSRRLEDSQATYEGGPIDAVTRTEQLARVDTVLQPLVDAGKRGEAAIAVAIEAYDRASVSSDAELAGGTHKIQVRVKGGGTQDFIVFLLSVGPTVTITTDTTAA